MRRSERSRRRVSGISGWLVLAALLGLFAMHGLGAHGSTSPAAATAEAGAAHAVHAGHQSGMPGTAGMGDPGSGPDDQGSGHDHLALVGLCLAVLTGALAAFALPRPGGRRGWSPPVALLAELRNAPAARRFRDPPCLFRLSVQRC